MYIVYHFFELFVPLGRYFARVIGELFCYTR